RLRAVAKAWLRSRGALAELTKGAERSLPGEAAEGHYRPALLQEIELALEVWQAGIALLGRRAIRRRRAAHHRGHVGAAQREPIPTTGAGSLVGEAGSMQRCVEPVSRSIAGKYAAGSVRPVGCRREADDCNSSLRIAEAADRSSPIALALVSA